MSNHCQGCRGYIPKMGPDGFVRPQDCPGCTHEDLGVKLAEMAAHWSHEEQRWIREREALQAKLERARGDLRDIAWNCDHSDPPVNEDGPDGWTGCGAKFCGPCRSHAALAALDAWKHPTGCTHPASAMRASDEGTHYCAAREGEKEAG